MRRCLELAKNGLGTTYPNPMVGSVIVYNDTIIGEGWHKKSGEPHAEVNAVNSVKDKSLLKNSTIYVSLEPCSHFGKTPPCCDLIVQNGIPNVIIGTIDPNIKVAGNGIKKLIESGHNVLVGILEEECKEINKRFFTYHQKKRPYVILKWAESQDGFIAPKTKLEQKPVWLSSEHSRQLAHKWRSEEQSILIGTNTAIDDKPRLNTRDWSGTNPVRLILDQNSRIPKENPLFDNTVKTIFFSNSNQDTSNKNTITEVVDFTKNIAEQVLHILYKYQLQSVIIEGGTQTLHTFIKNNIWDEARVFIGNTNLESGIKAPSVLMTNKTLQKTENDTLIIYRNL
jgi:diaminohydroxyphosphoribosylaminopyrimidine deaminase/5-amino-6-(5-phosphoribosylamino)uracil reductase